MPSSKIVKNRVVAFRVSADEFAQLEKLLLRVKVAGVVSVGALAHKMICDLLHDRLLYRREEDRTLSPAICLLRATATAAAKPAAKPARALAPA